MSQVFSDPRRDGNAKGEKADRSSRKIRAPVAVMATAQLGLMFFAAASEVQESTATPPDLAAALAFSLLFVIPGLLALLRSGPLAFPSDTADDRRLWKLLGLVLLSVTANLAAYRVGLVLGQSILGLGLSVVFFSTTIILTALITFSVVRRNASGLEIPVDVLDVFVFAVAVLGLMEVVGGTKLAFSPEALGTRAWIAVGGVLLGFYLVSRVHGYRGLPFAKHILAPVVTLVLLYSTYSALTFRFPSLPYWPDPVLRALASGSVFLIPLLRGRRSQESLRPQHRYETYRVSLAFLAAVLLALVLEVLIEGRGGVAATLQGEIVVITGLILARQYLSYLHGKKIFQKALEASQLYTSLVEEAADPIVELDPDGCITLVNEAFCNEFLVSKDIAIGRKLSDLVERSPFDFEIAPEPKPSIENSHRAGDIEPANVIKVGLRTPHGEKIFEATGRQSGSRGLQLILRDVTKLRGLDDQIAKLSSRLTSEDRSRQELLMRLIGVFEDERRRTAKKLVEGPAQDVHDAARTLAAISTAAADGAGLDQIDRSLLEARTWLSHAVRSLRQAIEELRPTLLEQKGLAAAVRALANEISRGSHAAVEVSWRASPHLSHGQENLLYTVIRDIFSEVKGGGGLQSVKIEATDFGSGGLRLELRISGESIPDSIAGATARQETADSGNSPDGDAEMMVTPKEKIEAIGGTFDARHSGEEELAISIEVESIVGRNESHPRRESA
jgi:PAS domain S-box-containing protein